MRVTNSMYYKNIIQDQNSLSSRLNKVNEQLSSGVRIRYGSEDPMAFAKTLKLDNEISAFEQISSSSTSALKFSTQTDSTLMDVTTQLDQFKVKLVNAASGTQSDETMDIIAGELEGIKERLIGFFNTSIAGEYIFSGTATTVKPLDSEGNYAGNSGKMEANIGNNVKQQYNIPGADLFFGEEVETNKKVTLNIPMLNQSKLYPQIMESTEGTATYNEVASTSEEVYITESDTIRDLIGDTDSDPTNDTPHFFYVRGTSHTGESFKQAIQMQSTDTVGSLLSNIAQAFGGTNVVKVELNSQGQIEVTDKISGSSKLSFHMVASDKDITTDAGASGNIEDLLKTDVVAGVGSVTTFMRSDYGGQKFSSQVTSLPHPVLSNTKLLATEFVSSDNTLPTATDDLQSFIKDSAGLPMDTIDIVGTDSAGNAVNATFTYGAANDGQTFQALMTFIGNAFSANAGDITVTMDNGVFNLTDNSVLGNQATQMDITTLTTNNAGNPLSALRSLGGVTYDNNHFDKVNNNTLTSNIAQVLRSDNSFPTDATKLSEVAALNTTTGVSLLEGATYTFNGVNTVGEDFAFTIDFGATNANVVTVSGNTYDTAGNPTAYTFDVLDASSTLTQTTPSNMTYRQLYDVVNMVMSDTFPAGATKADYDTAIQTASNVVNTSVDESGHLTVKDLTNTGNIEMILYDNATISNFSTSKGNGAAMSFQANDALTITDPKTNFFAELDEIITSVKENRIRPDGNSSDPRNNGVENAIDMIDSLMQHVESMLTKTGMQSQTLTGTIERVETMVVSTKTLKSDVIDTDFAEASIKLNQLTLNLQAMFSTISKVSQLSLVNYI